MCANIGNMNETLLTGKQKAEELGITPQGLNQRVRKGQIDYVLIPKGKGAQRFYYPESINLSIEMKLNN